MAQMPQALAIARGAELVAEAEDEHSREVFITTRAANIKDIVQTSVVAAFALETVVLTLFLIYSLLIDENWFNWLEGFHVISWVVALSVLTNKDNILNVSQILMYVSMAVIAISDATVIGLRSSTIFKGFEKDDKRDRQIAMLIHTIILAIVSLMYVTIGLHIRANYPKMQGELGETDAPSDVKNAEINLRYREFDMSKIVGYSELGRIVYDVRTRERKQREKLAKDEPPIQTVDIRSANSRYGHFNVYRTYDTNESYIPQEGYRPYNTMSYTMPHQKNKFALSYNQ